MRMVVVVGLLKMGFGGRREENAEVRQVVFDAAAAAAVDAHDHAGLAD